ncbi:phthalate transporter [Moniliophthora roreri MCA 2997]|uniref:Phthalate transporter n=1 Tax=Moniliophthora roreri (strain MCA 2997) TaxID=1381753 RepID=V2YCB7_MONRO|nr:phthalate transporter [Moniliophthora roreri MCA 2997]
MAHLTHTSPKTTLHTKSNMSDIKSNSDFGELHSTIDPVTEKRLLRKLDWQLLPLFTIIYCINFIDRTAIGNAKIAGIEKDLHMSGFNYNIVLIVFYIFYAIAEVPSNLTLTHFGLVWLAALVTTFELVMIGTVFVARVFLGIAEGGTLVHGLIYYVLSGVSSIKFILQQLEIDFVNQFYHQSELILCVGIFFGLSPSLAGAFGGLLASSLLSIGDINSVTSWRKVFLIEGVF